MYSDLLRCYSDVMTGVWVQHMHTSTPFKHNKDGGQPKIAEMPLSHMHTHTQVYIHAHTCIVLFVEKCCSNLFFFSYNFSVKSKSYSKDRQSLKQIEDEQKKTGKWKRRRGKQNKKQRRKR